MNKIFIVEDDENIRELLLYALNSNGFEAMGFESAESFWNEISENIPDIVLLDIMLPKESGTDILKKIRKNEKTKNLPAIMLTAKSTEMDKVKSFSYGADDYITKPFSVLELVARIKAVLKRADKDKSDNIVFKNITIIPEKRLVSVDDENIQLTYKEFELLLYLIKNKEIVLSRNQILENIWGYEFEGESRTVDMHIKTLRKKLLDSGKYIKTIRSVGYMIGE